MEAHIFPPQKRPDEHAASIFFLDTDLFIFKPPKHYHRSQFLLNKQYKRGRTTEESPENIEENKSSRSPSPWTQKTKTKSANIQQPASVHKSARLHAKKKKREIEYHTSRKGANVSHHKPTKDAFRVSRAAASHFEMLASD